MPSEHRRKTWHGAADDTEGDFCYTVRNEISKTGNESDIEERMS